MKPSSVVIWLTSSLIAGLAGLAGIAVDAPSAHASGGDYAPVGSVEFEMPGKPDGALELANWWRSFGGRYPDGAAPPPLVWSTDRATTSRNHLDYLARIRAQGSNYCGHREDPAHPAGSAPRTHNVLFCGRDLVSAIDGWLETPLHGAPFLSPRRVAVGAAANSAGSAAGFERGDAVTEPYVFPAPGGVMPLLEWLGGEIPDPTDDCPSAHRHGPPIHAFLPDYPVHAGAATTTASNWTIVSSRLTTASGQGVAACLIEWVTPVGPGSTVGREVYFFPKQGLVDGETYRATIVVDPAGRSGWSPAPGVGRLTLDWRFTARDWRDATRGPRLLDTRGAPTGEVMSIPVERLTGVQSDAVVLHVVAVEPDQNGFVTVWPCDDARPVAASLNYRAGANRGSTVVSKVGASGEVCVFTRTPTQVVVDFAGAFNGTYEGRTPTRVLDTRPGPGQVGYRGDQPAGSTVRLDVGDVVTPGEAVGLTVVAVEPGDRGFVTVWPCDQPRPTAANLNYERGTTVANAVIARPDADGAVCLFTRAAAHLVADLSGVVAGQYRGRSPTRVLDTRDGTRPASGSVTEFRPGTPHADAVVLNIAAVDPADRGFLTVWPCDQPRPATSTLNYAGGAVVANLAVSELAADGTVCVFARTAAHLVVDLQGELG